MQPPRLRRDLRTALVDVLSPHTLTRPMAAGFAEAIRMYHSPLQGLSLRDTAPTQWRARRRTMEQAAEAATTLLARLDALDRVWERTPARDAPSPDTSGKAKSLWIADAHVHMRTTVRVCRDQWRAWLQAPYTQPRRRGDDPRDARRRSLAVAVVFILDDAKIPLTLNRRGDVVQEVLRVMLGEADRFDGCRSPARTDLYRTARTAVSRARWVMTQMNAQP